MLQDCPQLDWLEVNGGGDCELERGGEHLTGRSHHIKSWRWNQRWGRSRGVAHPFRCPSWDKGGGPDDREWVSDLRGMLANCRAVGRGGLVPDNLIKVGNRIRAASACCQKPSRIWVEREALSRLSWVGKVLSCFQDTRVCGQYMEETWGPGHTGRGGRRSSGSPSGGGGKGHSIDAGPTPPIQSSPRLLLTLRAESICFPRPQRWDRAMLRPTQGRNTLVLSERSWAETRATCFPGKAHMSVMPSLLSLPFFLPYWPLPQLIKMLTFLASEKQNPALKILYPFLATGLTSLPLSAKKLERAVRIH